MVLKKISSIILLCAVTMGVMAVPARREGVLRTAEDGTQKMVFLHGDAFFHYVTDEHGTWLDETTLKSLSEEKKVAAKKAGLARVQERKAKMVGGEPNIAPRGLIILVNFSDVSFTTPKDTIDSMMNAAHFTRSYYSGYYKDMIYASGSARKYFQDQSYGQYNPVFDVVGPYTLSRNVSYYGGNNSQGNDKNPGKMIKEACLLANDAGADFTLYDNNNDGKVDFVYVIYAGEGEADGGAAYTIWPHNYDLAYTGESCTVDGKQVRNYACSNEINHYSSVYAGLGTFVHEFGHVIGLPDIYSTDNNSVHKTNGMWDIMDYGPYNNDGNTPPGYSAYERFYCGWLTPRVLTEAENVTLQPIDNQEALLICSGDQHNLVGYNPNPATFYLLEARNLNGWDTYLPGHGMLITKVVYDKDTWENNHVNYSGSNMHLDILEADGLAPTYSPQDSSKGWFGRPTDAYPAGANSWTGFANHEITDIARNNTTGAITFKYRGGKDTTELVQTPSATQQAQKILRNGKIVIIRGNKEYDILGHENHQL